MATNILQGDPTLLKACTDLITEDNNGDFARGYPNQLSFSLFFYFDLSGISSNKRREQLKFYKGFPQWNLFFSFFGQQYQVTTRQAGMWIDLHFSGFSC